MFLYIESVKFYPLTLRSIKIDVAVSILKIINLSPGGGGGEGGHRVHERRICARGDILTPARNRFLPLLANCFPHFGIHLGREGGLGEGSLTCAGILEQSMGARN
jgi:hypothetical protein